jgi:phage gpG-like protein
MLRRKSAGCNVASLTIRTNLGQIIGQLKRKLEILRDREYLLRPVAIELIPEMTQRIHQEGKASDGGQIGTYSNSYLKQRERNKRGADTKVIVSLTRQLENDWAVVPTEKGYGIGFNNPLNVQKMRWVEANKKKVIANLSENERRYAIERINELVNAALGS